MEQLIHEFVMVAKKLKAKGLVSDGVNKGSLSCRAEDGSILISPSKLSYDELDEKTVNIMRLDGTFVRQGAPISRDSYFHLEIYNTRSDVNAVIHTHSTYATALALAGKELPFITYGMKFHCNGPVKVAPFALPNTALCNQYILEYLADRKAVLLENHGLVCVEKSLANCFETADFVEQLSESYLQALLVGAVKEIKIEKEETYG